MADYDIYKPEWTPKDANEKFASFVMTGVEHKDGNLHATQKKVAGPPKLTADDYVKGILDGDRMIISRAITIIESNAPKHFALGQEIVRRILPYTGNSIRVGITGVPGAGKSTFIEALGTMLCHDGYKVAVLAVDPSSSVSHGSILGDKTRMEHLSREENAFIRPSPSAGNLGGVTRKSRETMLICEAAGYDAILVETVGVGQSETAVRAMVDFFLTVVITGAGDDLQGMKKGIIELSDAILVNKADGDNKQKAIITCADYNQILHYLSPATEGWTTHSYTCSAYTGEGVREMWDVICSFKEQMEASGLIANRRKQQNLSWVRDMTEEHFRNLIWQNQDISSQRRIIEQQVLNAQITPTEALHRIVTLIDDVLLK